MEGLKPTDPQRVGRYRLSALLGAGGMGRVFLGRSPSGRLVAVKVVRPELAEDPGFRRRFAREVAAARKVTGFFTAAVVDADPDGSPPWLATAYVPGAALDQAVAAHGPWPVASVRALGAGLAEALEAIHAAGLVHRDLKPSNVLIAPDGPRVVDFGISVATEATALTRTGTILGTPGFMAPEQLTGEPTTPATDVFAFGAVLAYAATGTGPFGTGSAQSLNFRIAYEEPRLAALPGPGLEIIARCLAKDPAERPSVAELIDGLAQGTEVAGHPPTEVVTQPAAWLPDPVARALSATVTATAPAPPKPRSASPARPPAPPAPPRPSAPRPAPSPPRPARAARAATPAASPVRPGPTPTGRAPEAADTSFALRRSASFWVAAAALVLALLLPFHSHRGIVQSMYVTYWVGSPAWPFGVWPLLAAILLAVGTCAAALTTLRRAPDAPLPPHVRLAHAVSSVLTVVVFAYWVAAGLAGYGDLSFLDSGAWVCALGCAALVRSLFRLRGPGRSRRTRTPPA